MGIYFRNAGQPDSAHHYLDLSWQRYLKQGREDRTANVLNSKALIYQDEGNYPASLQLFFQALQQARENHQKATEGLCLANIARVLQELGMDKESEPYATQALSILQSTEEFVFKGGLYRELGQYHRIQKKWDIADSSFAQAIRMGESSQNTTLQVEGWLGLSSTQLDRGNFAQALTLSQQAKVLLPKDATERLSIKLEHNLALAMAGLGQNAAAMEHAARWAQLAQQGGQTQELAEALRLRSELAGQAGDFRHAHEWGSLSAHLRDSLSGAAKKPWRASKPFSTCAKSNIPSAPCARI
jgi:tetratricopeptide (TPR) repeat protein